MNNGAFGENFPYSNFHDLNMDWIIKIAKDFLDQYTHIQQIIANGEQSLTHLTESGLTQLQNKADTLEGLLQAWYDTHSADIAEQLADAIADLQAWYDTHSTDIARELTDAIADFNTAAETKSQALLDSWPSDYSELVTRFNNLRSAFVNELENKLPYFIVENEYINSTTGEFQNYSGWKRTELIPLTNYHSISVKSSVQSGYNAFYKSDKSFRSQVVVTTNKTEIVIPDDCAYIAFSNTNTGMATFEASFKTKDEKQITENKLLAVSGIGRTFFQSSDFVAPYNNCDTLPNNSVLTITIVATSLMDNLPNGFENGTILTVNARPADNTSSAQFAIGKDGNIYARHKWGNSWGAWNTYSDSVRSAYTDMSMFPDFGVVGDSFANGTILIQSGVIWGMYPKYAWGTILSRIIGSEVTLYASSGLSTRTWLTDANGLQQVLADTPKALYLLCLGVNDGSIYNSDSSYLGTINDIKEDYTQNPDTFYGNYGKIIDQLIEHAPNAKIIMIAPPAYDKTTTWQIFQTAITNIAQHYSIPYIAGNADPYFESSFFKTNKANNHPIAITYSGMAKAYKRQIEIVMENNPQYFQDVH